MFTAPAARSRCVCDRQARDSCLKPQRLQIYSVSVHTACVCVRACVRACAHVCAHVYACVYTRVCVRLCVCCGLCFLVCVPVCVHVCAGVRVCACEQKFLSPR